VGRTISFARPTRLPPSRHAQGDEHGSLVLATVWLRGVSNDGADSDVFDADDADIP
jgi:hypothetical protein